MARLCSWRCRSVPWPFGALLSLSLCGLLSPPRRKRSLTPVISRSGHFRSGGYAFATGQTDLPDSPEQEPGASQDFGPELDPGRLLDLAAGARGCLLELKTNRNQTCAVRKLSISVRRLLPILKPALLPFCSSHLSSALLIPPLTSPGLGLSLPHHWGWRPPLISDPTVPPVSPSPHISSAHPSCPLPAGCSQFKFPRESLISPAHHILAQPTDGLPLGQMAPPGQSALPYTDSICLLESPAGLSRKRKMNLCKFKRRVLFRTY